jgi:hypothetical protein
VDAKPCEKLFVDEHVAPCEEALDEVSIAGKREVLVVVGLVLGPWAAGLVHARFRVFRGRKSNPRINGKVRGRERRRLVSVRLVGVALAFRGFVTVVPSASLRLPATRPPASLKTKSPCYQGLLRRERRDSNPRPPA